VFSYVAAGIRYRPGRSMLMLVLAAVAIASAVLAPAYARVAQQSVLTDRLTAAPATATGLQVRSDNQVGAASSDLRVTVDRLLQSRPTLRDRLDAPVGAAEVDTVIPTTADGDVAAKLAYRDDVCSHLTITGRCPQSPGEVLVSARAAMQYAISIGARLTPRARPANSTGTDAGGAGGSGSTPAAGTPLTVVGLYSPTDPTEVYWGHGGYFSQGLTDADSALVRVDTVFTSDEDDLALPGAVPSVDLDYRLRTDAVRLDDTGYLRADLAGLSADLHQRQLVLSTALGSVLDDITTDTNALGRTIPVIAIPLVVVCWFVLFLLVAALTDERAPEVALAKVRGFSPRRAAWFGRGEALWLIGVAAPVGVGLGLATVQVIARSMVGGPRVELRWPVALAAGLGMVGAYVTVRLAAAGIARKPALTLLRRVPPRSGWRAGLAEGILLALAAASLVAALGDRTAPLAMLAPALLALVVGIVAARCVGWWAALRIASNVRNGRLSALFANAQVARRALGHRVMLVVTVAVALLSFAAIAWDVAAQARGGVATGMVGADHVVQVVAASPESLEQEVQTADPSGQTMPVVRVTEQYGARSIELIGVASGRLATAARWRNHTQSDLAHLATLIQPRPPAPLELAGGVTVDLTAADITGSPRLSALVVPVSGPAKEVGLGSLVAGEHQYTADIAGCGHGCRLTGLAVGRTVPTLDAPIKASLTVTSISTDAGATPVDAAFDSGRWRVATDRAPTAQVVVSSGTALAVTVSTIDPADAIVEYVDTPDAIPVVIAGPTPADDPTATQFTFPALGDAPSQFTLTDHEADLPRVGGRALLFDLDYAVASAERSSSLSDNTRLQYEVWAGPGAPTDLAQRLSAAGLQVIGEQSIAAESAQMGRSAPALGLRLYLVAGAAALLLAVGAVLLSAFIGAGPRRAELAALQVAGVRPAVLRWALLREYALIVGVSVVVGLGVGVFGAVLMLPGIPLVNVGTPIGDVSYTPGPGALPMALGITVLGLLVALVPVIALVGQASPIRLRAGEQL
jgi:hypothetical protein